ncbi:MAG: hypothetical protein QOE35_3423 [Actinomycetota bacterium]|jgi:hypothetical protein
MSDQEPRRPQQNRRKSQNRKRRKQGKPIDLWRPVPELDAPEPIRPASDPTALLRSLGDPPLQGQGAVAEHYVAAVVERAAGVATALAAAAGLLATNPEEQSGD